MVLSIHHIRCLNTLITNDMRNIKLKLFTLVFLIVIGGPPDSYAQSPFECGRIVKLTLPHDTIEILELGDTTFTPRPTILFCQGSLPYPLVVIENGTEFIPSISNFDYKGILQRYNIVIIAMPHTPAVANVSLLNDKYQYVPDTSKPRDFDALYLEDNYLDNYVKRGSIVIDYLRDQSWVDKSRIIVVGHSQGAPIAAALAERNSDISACGYLSGNVLGRYAQYILRQRKDASVQLISNEQAQTNINNSIDFWVSICRNPNQVIESDPAKTWQSFGYPDIQRLVNLKMPVYLAYGTEDIGAQMCDLMPIYFELKGKTEYKIRPFLGCGHNFEEYTDDGHPDYNKMHWIEVMNEFIVWCEHLKL